MTHDKVLEQFHYFNILAKKDSVYGNWAVSSDGDVVNSIYPYAIMGIHLMDTNWMHEIREKFWFRPECEEHMMMALKKAKINVLSMND